MSSGNVNIHLSLLRAVDHLLLRDSCDRVKVK